MMWDCFSYFRQYHPAEFWVLVILIFVLVPLAIALWGRMWNKQWSRERSNFKSLVAIFFSIAFIFFGTVWLGGNSLLKLAEEFDADPSTILREAKLVNPEDYRDRLSDADVDAAVNSGDNVECRRLMFGKRSTPKGLFLDWQKDWFKGTTPIPDPTKYMETLPGVKGFLADGSCRLSRKELSRWHIFREGKKSDDKTKWGADAARYMLVRQNLELMQLGEKGMLDEDVQSAKICCLTLGVLFCILIAGKAYQGILINPEKEDIGF